MPEFDDAESQDAAGWKADQLASWELARDRLLKGFEFESGPEDAPVDTLGDATTSEASAAEADLKREQDRADINEAHDKNDLRKEFFTWSKKVMTASIIINALGMTAYVVSQWGTLTDGVMVGWFATTIVEVLGIGYIIGSYLFNGNGKAKPTTKALASE